MTPADASNTLTPCPHCKALARTERDAKFRFVCAACGLPRVPTGDVPVRSTGVELVAMRDARELRGKAFARRGLAYGLWAMGAFGFLLTLVFFLFWWKAAVVLGLLSLLPMLVGTSSHKKYKQLDAESLAKLDAGWTKVAEQVIRARGGSTSAQELAGIMQTDPDHAERLITLLSADSRVRVEVDDNAELRARVATASSEEDELVEIERELRRERSHGAR